MATKVEEPVEANNQTLQPPPPRHAGGRKPKDILIRAQVDIGEPDVVAPSDHHFSIFFKTI